MIRSSKHTIQFANTNKKIKYLSFIDEMRRISQIYVDYLWNINFEWKDSKGQLRTMDIKNKKYDIPPFFNYNLIPVETKLSARALSSLITQCMGIVKSNTEKQKKRLYILENKKEKSEKISEKLLENIKKGEPVKPTLKNINLEISSKCARFFESKDKFFDGFIILNSLGMELGKIAIPIKYHKQSNKWKKKSELLGSFLLSNKNITLRWESEVKEKENGIVVGGDTGKKTILTLSDNQTTPKKDKDCHSLDSIIDKLARKKKGSRNFKQAQIHRKDFINWSINQINTRQIKEIKLEKVFNITCGKRVNRKMTHWVNRLIVEKITRYSEEDGVRLSEQASAYKSQRCSCCGIVLKRNRKGKVYFCENCGIEIDSDFNAAKNNEIDLPEVPLWLSNLHLNKTSGFYWKPEGFFEVNGEELRVPHSEEK